MDLNPQQQRILENTDEAKLVIAGPGTGKTTTVCGFLARIIEEGKARPEEVLAVTFTVKAAREMKHRVLNICGARPHVGTIHSFATRVLRQFPPPSYNNQFTIIDDRDQYRLIRGLISSYGLDIEPQEVKEKLTLARNTRDKKFLDEDLQGLYEGYMKELKYNNAMDFDALLTWCQWTLENNQEALDFFAGTYKYLMVDEFQDTSRLQYDLLLPLAKRCGNLLCVGDHDQSIYSFRGADVGIILNLQKDFPKLKTYFLEENYRCSKRIVSVANSLIQNNFWRKHKPHWTKNDYGERISLKTCASAIKEATFVAQTIDSLHAKGSSLDSFAVLYRLNHQQQELTEQLVEMGISYRVVGDKDYFDLDEITNVLCILRLMHDPGDKEALAQAHSLFKTLSLRPGQLKQLLEKLQASETLQESYKVIMASTGYIKYLERNRSQAGLRALENVLELESVLARFNERGLREFLQYIDQAHGTEDQPAVNLMTIHAAKGLEFETVFVVGLNEGTLPHFRAKAPKEIEEERRMFYVAVTRAKERLHITYPRERMAQGKTVSLKESSFIEELAIYAANTMDWDATASEIKYSFKSKDTLRMEAEEARTTNPKGPWHDSSGNRWAVCQHCNEFTRDWWSLDGKENTCKCNDCKFQGKV